MQYSENAKRRRARRRLENLKHFYRHFAIYIVVNAILFIVRGNFLGYFEDRISDKNSLEWVDWNILIVPIFWGIGLLFHAIKVFQYKFPFIKNWEERQLKKFMDTEESKNI